MTRKYFAIALAASLIAALPASAQRFNISRDPHLTVNPISATTFEVIERLGAGARDVWCAAARYAIYTRGQTRGRLYIARARGPAQTAAGATGVIYSSRDIGVAGTTGVSVSTRVIGENLLVNHAIQFCRDYIVEPGDIQP